MEEVDEFIDKEINYFDECVNMWTITRFFVFEKNKKKLAKVIMMEAMVFSHAKTNIVSSIMNKKFIFWLSWKFQCSVKLKENYDHQGLTTFHDSVVTQQLTNDLLSTIYLALSMLIRLPKWPCLLMMLWMILHEIKLLNIKSHFLSLIQRLNFRLLIPYRFLLFLKQSSNPSWRSNCFWCCYGRWCP